MTVTIHSDSGVKLASGNIDALDHLEFVPALKKSGKEGAKLARVFLRAAFKLSTLGFVTYRPGRRSSR